MSIWFYLCLLVYIVVFLALMCSESVFVHALALPFSIGGIIFLFCGVGRPIAFNTIDVEYESREIESLTLNSDIHGEGHWAFTIGYAYVDEMPFYYFYENRMGGMYLNSVSATHSILIETDDCTPHIEIPKLRKFKDPTWLGKWWRTNKRLKSLENGIDFYEKHRKTNGTISWIDVQVNDNSMVKIYVPTGTIKKQFNADTANL